MGYAARANPRSFDGFKSERKVINARLDRFCDFFTDYDSFDAYCRKAKLTDEERRYLETRLSDRLKVRGTA